MSSDLIQFKGVIFQYKGHCGLHYYIFMFDSSILSRLISSGEMTSKIRILLLEILHVFLLVNFDWSCLLKFLISVCVCVFNIKKHEQICDWQKRETITTTTTTLFDAFSIKKA